MALPRTGLQILKHPPRESAVALLAAARLPTADLTEAGLEDFLYALDGHRVLGLVGLEIYGADALLRSLVVAEDERSRGLGDALVRRAENLADSRGVHSLYLLTLSAADFFRRRGYVPAARASAPKRITQTREFTELCPDSAVFLMKPLGR